MLRDRLVCGIHSRAVQRRLLQEASLTYDKALEIALSSEAAEKDSKRLTGGTEDKDLPAPVERVKGRPNSWNRVNRQRKTNKPQQSLQQGSHNSGKQVCHRCGGQHNPSDCPYECHYCKKEDIWPKSAGKR